jgi:hypothetical protein
MNTFGFDDFIWKQHKLLAGTRQTFGLELEGKTAKLLMMTLAYCSTFLLVVNFMDNLYQQVSERENNRR